MYVSIYNNYVVDDGRVVIYNHLTGSAIVCDSDSVNRVKEWLVEENTAELCELGLVTEKSPAEQVDEMRQYYATLRSAKKAMTVSLIMTYRCNCSCSYCFESLEFAQAFREDLGVERVVDYLRRKYEVDGAEEMNLFFFGGEPTLKADLIVEAMSLLTTAGVNVKPQVITNGVELCRATTEKLVAAGVYNYQITLDGPKEIHDLRRPMKSGSSSFDAIMTNLERIADLPVQITIRINVDSQNASMISEIYQQIPESIRSRPENAVYLAPVVGCKIGNLKGTLKGRTESMKRAWRTIKEEHLDIQVSPPVYAPCPNVSESSAFYIDLAGNVYTCGGFVGRLDKIEGAFDSRNSVYEKRMADVPNDKCFKCSMFPICMGGCTYETEELGGHCQKHYLKEMHDEYYRQHC